VSVRAAGVAGAPPGTTVEVRDLFAATPARRKFLRAPATEVGHAVDTVARLAVAFPAVGFRVEHDGRETLALPPVRDARRRVAQVLGPERGGALVPVDGRAGGYAIAGFVAPPRETTSTARLVWTYVAIGDGAARTIRDRVLLRAVLDGYESLLLRGRYPIAVVFVAVPPGEVDVNVHPAKLEVRFRRSAALHQLVAPAIRRVLTTSLAPSAATIPTPAGGVAEPLPLYVARSEPAPAGAQPELWNPAPRGFASLRFVGQIFDGYLLCEGDGRVVLIDQHAAHERVVFERLRAERRAGGVARDALLVPETIALGAEDCAALAEHPDALASAGLEGEPFGPGTYLLRTVPRLLRGRDAGALVRALAGELAEEGVSAAAERAADAALATIACHAVVRVGQRLDAAEVRALLASMDGVEISAHCPHGRPVAAELGRAQLEAMFRR
jgi:DNA mismatch repair protein MutL